MFASVADMNLLWLISSVADKFCGGGGVGCCNHVNSEA